MKKSKGLFRRTLCILFALTMAFGVSAAFAGCGGYKVTVKLQTPSLKVGETTSVLVAIAGTDNQDYTLSSSDEAVATVSEDGLTVTGVATGTAEIIATAAADGKSTGKATVIVGGGGEPGKPVTDVKIEAGLDTGKSDRLSEVGETTKITAVVTNSDDKTYTLSAKNVKETDTNEYVTVASDGTVTVKALPEGRDAFVNIIATANADDRKTAFVQIRIEAKTISGRVGDLTSEMIKAVGNDSITASGIIVDLYDDLQVNANDSMTKYITTVEMAENKWKGTWQAEGGDGENNAMVSMYARNDETLEIRPEEYNPSNSGHSFSQVYIDKNNEVHHETVRSSNGVPVLWENQCMYNLLGKLNVNNFETVSNDDTLYHYKNYSSAEDQLFMAQLGVSLTPLLTGDDLFSSFSLRIAGGKVTEIIAQTAITYNTGNPKTATAIWYTTVNITLSKVGETVVADPAPYTAPQNADILKSALEKMRAADSYYYEAADVQTQAPSTGDDYEILSAPAAVMSGNTRSAVTYAEGQRDTIWGNRNSNVGTVGGKAWVAENSVLLEQTSQYTASMDDKDKRIEYFGYRGFDGYVEKFAYSYATADTHAHFRGVQKLENANIKSVLPSFDFSEKIFDFVSSDGKNYTFRLKATDVMSDVAQAVSLYTNANVAQASTKRSFTITVNADGVVSTSFPYNISDNYLGYVNTTYKNIGSTLLPNLKESNDAEPVALFENYAPRVIPTSWSQMKVKHYHPDHTTQSGYVSCDAQTAFEASFGKEKADIIPTPDTWLWKVYGDIFDAPSNEDGYSGPFFDWNDRSERTYDIYTMTCRIVNDSSYPTDAWMNGLKEQMETELNKSGFTYTPAQSGKTNKYEGTGSRFITFTNADAQLRIQIENNYTNNFWIYIFELGAINDRTIVA